MTEALPSFPTGRPDGCPWEPPPGYAELRATDPVSKVSCSSGIEAWLVTGYEQARAALTDPALSSGTPLGAQVDAQANLNEVIAPGSIIQQDGVQHAKLRKLLTGEFTVRRVSALRPHIQLLIDRHIDRMIDAGGPLDLVATFAQPIPTLTICELLGVPYGQRDRFQVQSAVLTSIDAPLEARMQAGEEVQGFIGQLVLARLEKPEDDLISRLITKSAAAGDPLTFEELVVLSVSVLVAGHETTANMIALGMLLLLNNPDQCDALRADESMLTGAVEELLRYLSVVQFGLLRKVTADTDLDGKALRPGQWLVASLTAGNMDSSVFPDPQRLDLQRTSAARHLAFGFGAHQCVGQHLARLELRMAYQSLLTRLPGLHLAGDVDALRFKHDALVYGPQALPIDWA